MTEQEATALARKIFSDLDGYNKTVEMCHEALLDKYSQLSQKHPHQCAAWYCNNLRDELEQRYGVKILIGFQ